MDRVELEKGTVANIVAAQRSNGIFWTLVQFIALLHWGPPKEIFTIDNTEAATRA